MAKVKDFIVLCLDVGPSMHDPDNGMPLKTSIKIMNQMIQQKMFIESKDEIALVLFGTSGTENSLAESQGGYENITVARPMGVCDLDFLNFIHNSIQPGDTSADLVDALVVSMELINQAINEAAKVGEKRVYLFTDAGCNFNDDQLDQICTSVKNLDIHVTIVGPVLEEDDEDMDTGSFDRPLDEDGPGPSDTRRRRRRKRTKEQVKAEELMKRILTEVEGDSFSFSEALKLMNFLHQEKKQTTRFSGFLEIGKTMKIGCKMFTKMMAEKPQSWKKISAISQASRNPDKMAVTMVRSHHQQDEDETEVESDNITKGYRYGKSLIPISSADEEAMKLKAEKCLSLLGFTKTDKIKHHHYLGTSVLVVVATPGDKCAEEAMSALVRALHETNMVAIVRYVWRNNGNPKLAFLSPCIKKDYECLQLTVLPFMEDIRHFMFTSLDKLEVSQDQQDAVDNLITSMDLMEAYQDEDGNTQEALKPKMLSNPLILRTFQCIQHRALNPGTTLPKLDPLIDKYLRPEEAIVANCTDQIQKIKDLFPLIKVEKKKAKTTAADVWQTGNEAELDLDAERPAKRARADEDGTDFTMASLARGDITQVGTTDPVGDYRTLLNSKVVDNYEDATKQLQTVVMKLVKESFGDTHYAKALECIKALREEAIKHEEADMFNNFLRQIKDDFVGTRYSAFWDRVVEDHISLITITECSDGGVTEEESKSFFESQAVATSIVDNEPDEIDDADDLLAMM